MLAKRKRILHGRSLALELARNLFLIVIIGTNVKLMQARIYDSKVSCKGGGYTEVPSNYTPYLYY